MLGRYGASVGQIHRGKSGAYNVALIKTIPNESLVDRSYFYHYLHSELFQVCLKNIAHRSAQAGFSKADIVPFKFPLPPLDEQKRIVAILDQAFEGVAAATAHAEKNLANARELFESYLNGVFAQGSENWKVVHLAEIFSIKHGFAFKSEFFTKDGKYVLLTPGSFFERGGFRDQGGKTKYYLGSIPDGYILNKGDFLFAMTEQAVGLLGSTLIVPKADKYLHNQRLGLIQPIEGFNWCSDFFFHQFNTERFRNAVQNTASGLKVRHTSPKKLGAISVCFPETLSEQKIIADRLNELSAETERLKSIYERKFTALTELKQSLLQKAFSGELTAGDANIKEETAA